jgi:translin
LLNLKGVESSLSSIAGDLRGIEERRERILRQSRDVIAAASNAIVNIHVGRIKAATEKLAQAERILRAIRRLGKDDLKRYLVQPETEYVEAQVVAAVAGRDPLPSQRDLRVGGPAYLLGLLDAVGEMKRLVYDRIRRGRAAEASRLFGVMQQLYQLVSPFAVHDHVAPGLRRKLDVARIIIEDTRAAVTEEIRRAQFIRAMGQLSERLPGIRR